MRGKAAITIVLLALLSARVAADPANPCPSVPCHLHMRESTTLTVDDGRQFRLPPGHFIDDGGYVVLDDEMRRLQDAETRLKAENQSLRGSMSGWQPGWLTLTVALVGGFAGGVATYYYATHR